MEFRKSQTIYMQIADHICERILAGKIPPGERMESVREMASQTEVNPNTVMRTFSFLQEQDIIFNKRGIGYFVAEDAVTKIKTMKRQEFLKDYLPEFFKMMEMLDIDFEELQQLYVKTKKQEVK